MEENSAEEKEGLSLPCCDCMPAFERCLINNAMLAYLFAGVIYVPILIIFYVLWIIQIPVTIIVNVIVRVFCCDCVCFGSLCQKIANGSTSSISDATSSTPLKIAEKSNLSVASTNQSKDGNVGSNGKEDVTVFSFNCFGMYGAYWNRYPMWTALLTKYKPDIICIQEAITCHTSPISTLNTIYKLEECNYDGFFKSMYHVGAIEYPYIFRYSFIWLFINEVQTIANTFFAIGVWRTWFWQWSLRSNAICAYCFYFFIGVPFQFGNLIALKGKECHFKDLIPLQPGFRLCLRTLYVTGRNKRIWVYNTHLTAQSEKKYETSSPTTKQVEHILKWMKESEEKICRGDAIILCGDFNATPEMEAYQTMVNNGFKSAIVETQENEKYTYPTGTWTWSTLVEDQKGPQTLDYVWYRGNIEIKNAEIVGTQAKPLMVSNQAALVSQDPKVLPSDHFGILAKFTI